MEKPKARNPSVLSPKQAARVLTSNCQHQLEQRVPGEENETENATERIGGAAKRTPEELADGILCRVVCSPLCRADMFTAYQPVMTLSFPGNSRWCLYQL